MIDGECGILIPMKQETELVADLRRAMEKLTSRPDLCRQLADCAVERIRTRFTWDAKAEQLVTIYHEVLGGNPCQNEPEFELVTSA